MVWRLHRAELAIIDGFFECDRTQSLATERGKPASPNSYLASSERSAVVPRPACPGSLRSVQNGTFCPKRPGTDSQRSEANLGMPGLTLSTVIESLDQSNQTRQLRQFAAPAQRRSRLPHRTESDPLGQPRRCNFTIDHSNLPVRGSAGRSISIGNFFSTCPRMVSNSARSILRRTLMRPLASASAFPSAHAITADYREWRIAGGRISTWVPDCRNTWNDAAVGLANPATETVRHRKTETTVAVNSTRTRGCRRGDGSSHHHAMIDGLVRRKAVVRSPNRAGRSRELVRRDHP